MKPLILICVLLVGCQSVEAMPDMSGEAAVIVAMASLDSPATPAVVVPSSDQCSNCKGRGKVGDGVTMLTCAVCGGTGKAVKDIPPKTEVPIIDVVSPPDPPQYGYRTERRQVGTTRALLPSRRQPIYADVQVWTGPAGTEPKASSPVIPGYSRGRCGPGGCR